MQSYPLHSLTQGSWFKLICGASYQHLPAVRNLALTYSLAGADCIDVAADPAVVAAATDGIKAARKIRMGKISGASKILAGLGQSNQSDRPDLSTPSFASGRKSSYLDLHSQNHTVPDISPWLMVSINDGEDPHFRKATFDSTQCPPDCPQPCVQVCPAAAIDLDSGGVLENLCYGCGRCLPICPQDLITTHSYSSSISSAVDLIKTADIDAVEIHTQVGHYEQFQQLWLRLTPVVGQLKLIAISCTDAPRVIDYLRSLAQLIEPLPCPLIWQTDGRSMSGDIGKGTTHAAVSFAQKALEAGLPGYIQLAGGTNSHTVAKLKQKKMLHQSGQADLSASKSSSSSIAGVAYGSYARAILGLTLAQLEEFELHKSSEIQSGKIRAQSKLNNQPMNQLNLKLEENEALLEQGVTTARELVNQIKPAKFSQPGMSPFLL